MRTFRLHMQSRLGPRLRLIAVLLATIGLVAGLLAMHSTVGSHMPAAEANVAEGMPHSPAAEVTSATLGAVVPDALDLAFGGTAHCDGMCEMHCGHMNAGCLPTFVVAVSAFVAAFAASDHRLIERARTVLAAGPSASPAISRPSLTALSISRT